MTETSPDPDPETVRRKEFQHLLEEVGSIPVYFQPPPDVKMQYPCIVYERDNAWTRSADNRPYVNVRRYQVTVIDRNPDSDVIAKLAAFPTSSFSRHFATSGLNHDVFVIYY